MTSITNKPEWFNLNNYPDFNKSPITREWEDEAEWAYNFNIRKNIIHELDNSDSISESIRKEIDQCRDKGFLTRDMKFKTFDNVQPLLIKDIGDLYQSVNKNEKQQLDKYNTKTKTTYDNEIKTLMSDSLNRTEPFTEEEKKLLEIGAVIEEKYNDSTFIKDNLSYVSVKLNVPVSTLIDEFSTFVKEQKAKASIKHKTEITSKRIKKWAKQQILAYLDLCIYSKEMKSDIHQKYYGDWLYPDETVKDTTLMVRKTAQKVAVEVLKPHFIKYILSQSKAII